MKIRGFEVVEDRHRKFPDGHITLPTRADIRSAGYDFYAPIDYALEPYQSVTIWTDIKAYMLDDEFLSLHIRSSLGIKGLRLMNQTGIIDSSYYNNEKNDGNIGICIQYHPDEKNEQYPFFIKAGERIAQGIFQHFFVADRDVSLGEERAGGFGSSGK